MENEFESTRLFDWHELPINEYPLYTQTWTKPWTTPSLSDYSPMYPSVGAEAMWMDDNRAVCDIPPDIKILREELKDIMGTNYRVVCKNNIDFDPKRILKNLSIMKSNLMLACAPIVVKNIDCKMTPKVKENLITAYKRNKSFGKELPIVPRFDEFMNRLPDQININTLKGMNIEIVDPNIFGEYYLEFNAIAMKVT